MELERKALFNLIKINRMPGTDATLLDGTSLESWQMQNYRDLSDHDLIQNLHHLNIRLELSDFEAYAKNYDSPEEMSDSLAGDLDYKSQDKAFLILFELWRRHLPEKQSISIFCDELDQQIILYDRGETKSPSDIQDALAYLQNLLDENVDTGVDPHEAFYFVQKHCANDLESFLYDYILEEIEAGNQTYAAELLDGFSRYMSNPAWFDFLHLRIELSHENDDSLIQLRLFIEDLKKDKSLQLNLEVLQYLAKRRDRHHFISLITSTIPLIEIEEDFQDLLAISQSFFHEIDRNEEEKSIQEILQKRSNKPMDFPVKSTDPDLNYIKTRITT